MNEESFDCFYRIYMNQKPVKILLVPCHVLTVTIQLIAMSMSEHRALVMQHHYYIIQDIRGVRDLNMSSKTYYMG